jgi:G:T-mismatch repair DNA endonuclease (very short patch repair protein)
MPRWNNNLENNAKEVMGKIIKNLNPLLYQKLLKEILDSNITNNKKVIEQFLRDQLGLTKILSTHSKKYWILRGWTEEESYVKSKEYRRVNRKSVYSRDFWLEKINPITGVCYTEIEADFERNSRRPIRKEYWIKQGYTENEAFELAKVFKEKNNKKGAEQSSRSTIRKVSSRRCVDYYTTRGYSVEAAKEIISKSQKYFSKEICIQKYGEIEGIQIWKNRQTTWQNKLNAKSNEEKARINRLKLSKGISVSKAEKIIVEQLLKLGVSVNTQFTLFEEDKKQFVYDIMYNNKIIEYHGDFWHSNPSIYPAKYLNPRTKLLAEDKWRLDEIKIRFAKSKGYEVLIVWESDFKKDKEKVINQCIKFLTE